MGISIVLSFMFLVAVAVISTWAAKVTIKNLPLKQLEGKELGRPLGRPVEHRHFYLNLQRFVGGYLVQTYNTSETIGAIGAITIAQDHAGDDFLQIQYLWTAEREFGASSQWERYIIKEGVYCQGGYFNALHNERVYCLERAAIHRQVDNILIIDGHSANTYLLIPKKEGEDFNWEEISSP